MLGLKFLLPLLLLCLIPNYVSAAYIVGEITLDERGNAQFSVETDVPVNIPGINYENNKLQGATNQLLALRGGIWTFELSLAEYDDIFLEIRLPSNLESITRLSGSASIIDIENKVITIADSGKLDFALSYKLTERANILWVYFLSAVLLLIIIFLAAKRLSRKKERLRHILPLINEKEQQIIDVLMKKPMRQKELRKQLNIPKASFSRYLVNLEKKKLITREGEGKNKILRLK